MFVKICVQVELNNQFTGENSVVPSDAPGFVAEIFFLDSSVIIKTGARIPPCYFLRIKCCTQQEGLKNYLFFLIRLTADKSVHYSARRLHTDKN